MSLLGWIVIVGLIILFGVVAFSWLMISKEEDKHGGKGI